VEIGGDATAELPTGVPVEVRFILDSAASSRSEGTRP
jgi:hypothetical protein